MKFFIDPANLKEIQEAHDLGVLDGVTTNPSLMAKEGISGHDNVMAHYKAICDIVDGDISAEVIAVDYEGIIREGEILLLPGKTPHLPQRPANTIGLVIERYRQPGEQDGFLWFCENCGQKLYEEYLEVTDIVKQMPEVMNRFYASPEKRTCKNCGNVMAPPQAAKAE